MIRAAPSGGSGITFEPSASALLFVAVGLVVLFLFLVAARMASRFAADQLSKRHVRSEIVVISRRVVTFVVIIVGLLAAISFANCGSNAASHSHFPHARIVD